VNVEVSVTDPWKQIGDFQVLSGFHANFGSFFQDHHANEALKYSAISQENDVNIRAVFYTQLRVVAARIIELDVSGIPVHTPSLNPSSR